MNGKMVVSVMVVAVIAVLATAFWWPEGREDVADPPAQAEEPEAPEEPKTGFRVTERGADGSLTMTNAPEGADDPVAEARERRDARIEEKRIAAEEHGENPFQAFVDRGTPMTAEAMELPDMTAMDPTDSEYDPAMDAHQRFHGYEQEILEAAPLSPETWKAITVAHQDDIKGVFKRSKELVDAGENESARLLIEEWSELQNKYKAQAYGRSPQAFEPDE